MLTAMGYAVCAASTAQAAGFLLREQSAAGMGNAFAGATAGAISPVISFLTTGMPLPATSRFIPSHVPNYTGY